MYLFSHWEGHQAHLLTVLLALLTIRMEHSKFILSSAPAGSNKYENISYPQKKRVEKRGTNKS